MGPLSKKVLFFQVNMWVFEEIVDGEKLTDIINTRHENVKYLPGKKLPGELQKILPNVNLFKFLIDVRRYWPYLLNLP